MKKVLILISLSILCRLNIKGQTDTIISIKKTEFPEQIDHKREYKNQYLNANFREEKSLIKLGLRPLYFVSDYKYNYYASVESSLIFEKKIVPSFSILMQNNMSLGFFHTGKTLSFNGDIEVRYYYSMKKRMRESVGANNFHSNYFSVKLAHWYRYVDAESGVIYGYSGRYQKWTYNPDLFISWGMQRRIGKCVFYDIGPYISLTKYEISNFTLSENEIGINLVLGLCYGK